MTSHHRGSGQIASDTRIAIVVSRYNENITNRLLDGAMETIESSGIDRNRVEIFSVPGAWEIPLVAAKIVAGGQFRGIVCLGAVIRGETTHDQHINRAVSNQLMELSTRFEIPIGFGILTCNSMEQALNRAGGIIGNKGIEATSTVIELISLIDEHLSRSAAGIDGPQD